MEAMKSSFLTPTPPFLIKLYSRKPKRFNKHTIISATSSDPWSLSTGNKNKPKPISRNPKLPLSDDNARRIIKAKAKYLSELRRNQGSRVQTPRWIKRTPEQMVKYLEDDRNGHLYGKHVVAVIHLVRGLSRLPEGNYDMRQVMGSFVAKISFREMCCVEGAEELETNDGLVGYIEKRRRFSGEESIGFEDNNKSNLGRRFSGEESIGFEDNDKSNLGNTILRK